PLETNHRRPIAGTVTMACRRLITGGYRTVGRVTVPVVPRSQAQVTRKEEPPVPDVPSCTECPGRGRFRVAQCQPVVERRTAGEGGAAACPEPVDAVRRAPDR